jgi:hypothetical protein
MRTSLTPDQREHLEADLHHEERLHQHARRQAAEARSLGEDADSIDRPAATHAANAAGLRRTLGY